MTQEVGRSSKADEMWRCEVCMGNFLMFNDRKHIGDEGGFGRFFDSGRMRSCKGVEAGLV